MFVISILLSWLPGIGGFIAGFVGGRKAGTISRALMAVFLPAIIVSILFFLTFSTLTAIPMVGALAGGGVFLYAIGHIGAMLIGAIIGAVI